MKLEYWVLGGIAVLAGIFNWLDLRPLEYLAYGVFGLYACRDVFKA